MALIGSKREARYAGIKPATIPIIDDKPIPINTFLNVRTSCKSL